MVEGHILKFLERQEPPTQASRKIYPQQKYGHSKQSPDWFKRKFSLQSQGGYEYNNDEPRIRQRFKYLSQKNQFDIGKQYSKKVAQEKIENHAVHNLKKGLLSEYLDKNSWMKETVPLTGFERNEESRRLNNQDRKKNIEAVQEKKSAYIASKTASNFYSTKKSKINWNDLRRDSKVVVQKDEGQNGNPQNLIVVGGKSFIERNQTRSKSISKSIGEKQQIRSERNQLATNKIYKIQKFKLDQTLTSKRFRTIDSQFVQQRMAMSAREWGGKKFSSSKSIERFNEIIEIGSHQIKYQKNSVIKRLSVEGDLEFPSRKNKISMLPRKILEENFFFEKTSR